MTEQESKETERFSCPRCGGSLSGQPFKLEAMVSSRMMMNLAFILYVCLTKTCPMAMGTL